MTFNECLFFSWTRSLLEITEHFQYNWISDSSSVLITEKWWRLFCECSTVLSTTVTILPNHCRQPAVSEDHFTLRSRRKEVVNFIFSFPSAAFLLLGRICLGERDNTILLIVDIEFVGNWRKAYSLCCHKMQPCSKRRQTELPVVALLHLTPWQDHLFIITFSWA